MNQFSNINPQSAHWIAARRKKQLSISEYVEGIRAQNRVILSQAITLIESTKPEHQAIAQEIIEKCLPFANHSTRIGITGTPGVGKSTFIETIGQHFIRDQHRVAVLAIDPSSKVSHGSILGDKTRMEQLAAMENAFIRPSPAGDSLGGVARKTRETIVLCEAAGYDIIVIETVGVGQSEVAVHSMVDFFLLLLLPGGGDELQGIKRGIVEMADLIAVNKADDDRMILAKQARQAYRNALHLFPRKESGWIPQVVTCSALSKIGIDDIVQLIQQYVENTKNSQFFEKKRQMQAKYWLQEAIMSDLQRLFYQSPPIKQQLPSIEQAVLEGNLSPFKAAESLMALFLERT